MRLDELYENLLEDQLAYYDRMYTLSSVKKMVGQGLWRKREENLSQKIQYSGKTICRRIPDIQLKG